MNGGGRKDAPCWKAEHATGADDEEETEADQDGHPRADGRKEKERMANLKEDTERTRKIS